jgi:thiamine-monophosphate kinase
VDLAELGEFGLIEALRRRAAQRHPAWRVGIGDDAALLVPKRGEELALTTDALVEGVHFRWRTTDARALGHKTLAVNLSDLGAMGARPLGFLLTLALPPATDAVRLGGFVTGLLRLARASDCPLVGGDTVRSPVWSASVTAIGAVPRGRALLRSGARPGDRLFVTGALGGAAAGLALLEGPGAVTAAERRLARRQTAPSPPYRAGAVLARAKLAHAAIDVSDGLVQDVGHIAHESGVRAAIELERVPLAPGHAAAARRLGRDAFALALAGGEDYELAFSAPRAGLSASEYTKRLGCRVTEIGAITRGRGVVVTRGGAPIELVSGGFAHFKATSRASEK